MARRIFSGLPHFAHGSPAVTVRKSNHAVTLMSRSMETFFKWKPSSFAPVVMSFAPCKRSSAKISDAVSASILRHLRPSETSPMCTTAPSEPGFAPSNGTISSAVAGRTATAPVLAMNLVSFNWSSPRIKMMTGLLSAM